MTEVELRLVANNKGAVNGIKEVQKESDKLYTSQEKAQKRQVGLIADIEKELGKLQEKQKNAMSSREIEKYNQKIAEAKQALEEYNNAGLKVEKQTSGLGAMFGKLALQVGALVGVWKSLKFIIESTETTSLKFHSTVNALKSGLDFLAKSIASLDFKNFTQGLKEAIKAGSDYTKELERIGNVRRAFQLEEADLNKKIEEQRRIFYEDDKTSLTEKLKAGDEMLKAMEQKANMEVKIARESYLAVANLTEKKNQLAAEDIDYAIRNFEYVEKTGTAYNKLNDLVQQYYKNQKNGLAVGDDKTKQYVEYLGQTTLMTEENLRDYENAIERLGAKAPYLGKLVQSFGKVTEAEKQTITDGLVSIKQAENQYLVESKRVFRMVENMEDRFNKELEDGAKERKKISDDEREQLEKDASDYYKTIGILFKKFRDEKQKEVDENWKFDIEIGKKTFAANQKQAKETWDAMIQAEKDAAELADDLRKGRLEAVKLGLKELLSFTQQIADNELEDAERRRELLDTRIEEANDALETEMELYRAGYASNVGLKQKEIEQLKALRAKALKDEEEALKKQRALEAVSQGINIFSSVTQILKSTTKFGVVGIALAAGAIATMFTIIAAAKAKTKEAVGFAKGGWTGDGSYRDSTGEKVAGTVHEREFVVRKGPAHKFRDVLEAINRDDKRMVLASFNRLAPEGSTNNILIQNDGPNKRLDEVNSNLRRLNSKEEVSIQGNKTIIKKGSTVRIIKR